MRLLIALLAALLISANGAQAQQTVKIGTTPSFVFLPLYVAEQLGYFKAEGITAQFVDFEGGAEVTTAMVGGSIDAGGTMIERPLILSEKGFGAKNLLDPAENIRAGIKYLHWLLAYFEGDVSLALAAGDLDARLDTGTRTEPIDGVIEGLNMLAEELSASTAALRRSEESFRSLIERSPDAMFVHREDARPDERARLPGSPSRPTSGVPDIGQNPHGVATAPPIAP